MSGIAQRRKGLKPKQLICTNGRGFSTKEAAKAYIEILKNRGQRGSRLMETFRCEVHSNKSGDIYHVRQRRRHHGEK